jgi:predicted metalloprotease
MDLFMRDVLAHEIGHHVRNQVARYPRTARTADEEAVADLHARRTRVRLRDDA